MGNLDYYITDSIIRQCVFHVIQSMLLFPEMRVTRKIFTRATVKKKKDYQFNFSKKVYI